MTSNTATPLLLALTVIASLLLLPFMDATKWAQSAAAKKEPPPSTVTTLEFYFHDTISGKNPSSILVAHAKHIEKPQGPTPFGALYMADDPLTETPDINSKPVGRAQGLYGSSGQQELGLIMAMSFTFSDGKYNGSTVSIFGKNPITHPVKELPVVGGTGIFRLARGYAIAHVHWFNAKGDAIVGYNLTVVHHMP